MGIDSYFAKCASPFGQAVRFSSSWPVLLSLPMKQGSSTMKTGGGLPGPLAFRHTCGKPRETRLRAREKHVASSMPLKGK